MHNCPNCGSPIDPYKTKCEYCGTYCFDFSGIDFTEHKPVFIKLKVNRGYPNESEIITSLAIPTLENIEVNIDTTDMISLTGDYTRHVYQNRTCEMSIKFNCIPDPQTNRLFTIETEG